jgi:hypothetical protein
VVKAVTYILENDSTVQGLVGNKTTVDLESYHKIYPVVAPSNEIAPYCVARQSGKSVLAKDCDFGYFIDVMSFADSYDSVTTLNDAVIAALTAQAPGTVNGIAIGRITFNNEVDGYDVDRRLYVKTTTFESNSE